MRNQNHALALAGKVAHDFHQLQNFLRGEGAGRLVENQNVRAAVEHLQDLHALLHADGNILDLRVRIDVQAVAL